jgi:predicted MFS family arabinose efflux permease
MFGVMGDRLGHRTVLAGMRAIYTTVAFTIMVLAFAGVLNPFIAMALAGVTGLVRPSDQGVRAALVADIVPVEHLTAASSIARTTTDMARIAGALVGAGIFATLGLGPAYVFVTATYGIGFALTLCIGNVRPVPHSPDSVTALVQRASPWRDLREGMGYIARTPHLLAGMWLAFLVNLCAFPLSNGLLPYVARHVYHTDQTGLGYLAASFASGAVIGSILLSLTGSRIRPARMMIFFSTGWYLTLLVFAQTRTLPSGMLALFLTGFVQSLAMLPLTVLLLRTSDDKYRGRVMGVRMMAIYSLPIGLLSAGTLVEYLGFTGTATLYSIVGLAFVAMIALRWRDHLFGIDKPGNAV